MTSFSQIVFEPGGVVLSVFALLTLFGQIYAVIAAFSQKRNIALRLTMVLQLVNILLEWMVVGSMYGLKMTPVIIIPKNQ